MLCKEWRGLWAISVIQSEVKFLCHTVYIRLLLLLFLETESTLAQPIALASRCAARLMHLGPRPVIVPVDHPSLPVLQRCCDPSLGQLNQTVLHDLWRVLEKGAAFRTAAQVCSEKGHSVQGGCCPDSLLFICRGEYMQRGNKVPTWLCKAGWNVSAECFFSGKKKRYSATLKSLVNQYLLYPMLSAFYFKTSFIFVHI